MRSMVTGVLKSRVYWFDVLFAIEHGKGSKTCLRPAASGVPRANVVAPWLRIPPTEWYSTKCGAAWAGKLPS